MGRQRRCAGGTNAMSASPRDLPPVAEPLVGTRQVGWNGYRLTGIVIVVVGEPFVSESSGLAASKEEV